MPMDHCRPTGQAVKLQTIHTGGRGEGIVCIPSPIITRHSECLARHIGPVELLERHTRPGAGFNQRVLDALVILPCLHSVGLDAVADDVEWQNAERLLTLHANLLHATQHRGDGHRDGRSPLVCRWEDGKRQEREPDEQEARRVAGVRHGDGRAQQALAATQDIVELRDVGAQRGGANGVHLGVHDDLAHRVDGADRAVGCLLQALNLLVADHAREQLAQVGVGRLEVRLKGNCVGDRPASQRLLDLGLVVRDHRHAHTHNVAAAVEQQAPHLACFVPAPVRRIGAEHQQQRQHCGRLLDERGGRRRRVQVGRTLRQHGCIKGIVVRA
mmetsp:Transcript_69296/g.152943  ORF Transcript_69296/g.152943 Transcript_69296/m.152943 type:complete len:328 (-) Transcript_69296:373-1356(-)